MCSDVPDAAPAVEQAIHATRSSSAVRVQVVLVTYNRADCLRAGLAALQRQTHPIERIWVIDNASTDTTGEVLQQAQAMGMPVVVERLPHNLGGEGGFAHGFERARRLSTDWVWVMADDVEPEPECLSRLIAASEGYDMLQANRYQPGQGFIPMSAELNFAIPWKAVTARWVRIDDFRDERVLDIAATTFEGVMIRHEHVVHMDLPDARYFLWCDDWDYSIRLARRGGRIGLCGGANMRRMLPATHMNWQRAEEFSWRDYLSIRNPCWIDITHGGKWFGWIRTHLRVLRMFANCVYHLKSMNSYRIVSMAWLDALMGRARAPEWLMSRFKR